MKSTFFLNEDQYFRYFYFLALLSSSSLNIVPCGMKIMWIVDETCIFGQKNPNYNEKWGFRFEISKLGTAYSPREIGTASFKSFKKLNKHFIYLFFFTCWFKVYFYKIFYHSHIFVTLSIYNVNNNNHAAFIFLNNLLMYHHIIFFHKIIILKRKKCMPLIFVSLKFLYDNNLMRVTNLVAIHNI